MNIENILAEKRPTILEKWLDLILATYPADAARFFKEQKNQFANPVGSTIAEEVKNLFDEVVQGTNPDQVSQFLENIVRIRAIQDFTPSQALRFLFSLKSVIRAELAPDVRKYQLFDELLTIESRIDELALLSFDIFLKCREKIYEIRTTDLRNKTYLLLKRAKLVHEIQEDESDGKDGGCCSPR